MVIVTWVTPLGQKEVDLLCWESKKVNKESKHFFLLQSLCWRVSSSKLPCKPSVEGKWVLGIVTSCWSSVGVDAVDVKVCDSLSLLRWNQKGVDNCTVVKRIIIVWLQKKKPLMVPWLLGSWISNGTKSEEFMSRNGKVSSLIDPF